MKTNFAVVKTLTILFALAIAAQLNAQVTFSHALGAGIYTNKYGGAPAVFYHPRLNVAEIGGRGSDATISVGIPLGLGFSFNSREGASSFCLDAPVTADINLGHASNPDADSRFGGFAGVGFAYNILGGYDDVFGGFTSKNMGPLLHAGMRFVIRERSIGLRASYMFNIKGAETSANVLGLNLFYTFGEY